MATAYANNDKPLFPRGLSLNARALLLCLASILLLGVDHYTDQLKPVRKVLASVTYPLDIVSALPTTTWRWAADGLASRNALLKQNNELRRNLILQNAEIQRMSTLKAENQRLRQLLQSSSRVQTKVLVAEIIGVDMDPYHHTVTVNKGVAHGVYDGQPLIDAHGVLGQINSTAAMSAEAVLLTDANHAIPVVNNRSGVRTVAHGTGHTEELLLPYLPEHSDMQAGDLLVTSGLGGRFPPGYPVATVSEVERNLGDAFAIIHAKPVADVTNTQHMLLVWYQAIDNPTGDEAENATAETGQNDNSEADSGEANPSNPAPSTGTEPATAEPEVES